MVADVNFRAEKRDTFGTLVDEVQPLAPYFIGFPRALSYIWLTKRALNSFFLGETDRGTTDHGSKSQRN
jgi:hypothetical protein